MLCGRTSLLRSGEWAARAGASWCGGGCTCSSVLVGPCPLAGTCWLSAASSWAVFDCERCLGWLSAGLCTTPPLLPSCCAGSLRARVAGCGQLVPAGRNRVLLLVQLLLMRKSSGVSRTFTTWSRWVGLHPHRPWVLAQHHCSCMMLSACALSTHKTHTLSHSAGQQQHRPCL